MNETDKEKVDHLLCAIDDECIARGEPPLSVLVAHDDGAVSTAFLRTMRKHGLRWRNESEAECVARYRDLVTKFHQTKNLGE